MEKLNTLLSHKEQAYFIRNYVLFLMLVWFNFYNFLPHFKYRFLENIIFGWQTFIIIIIILCVCICCFSYYFAREKRKTKEPENDNCENILSKINERFSCFFK